MLICLLWSTIPGITALIQSEPKRFKKCQNLIKMKKKQERKGLHSMIARVFKAKFQKKNFKANFSSNFFKANLNTFDEWFPSRIIYI